MAKATTIQRRLIVHEKQINMLEEHTAFTNKTIFHVRFTSIVTREKGKRRKIGFTSTPLSKTMHVIFVLYLGYVFYHLLPNERSENLMIQENL